MGRVVALAPRAKRFERTPAGDTRAEGHFQWELETMFADRHPQESSWREDRRQYAALPKSLYRNTPVPNAPNVEVPLGAIHADALYAQMTTVLYSGSPLLTARANDELWNAHAKDAQRWVNYLASNEVRMREATDHAFADCVQMGTAAFYVPYTESAITTKLGTATARGPRILPIAPENLLFVGGSRGILDDDRWVGLRWWLSPADMRARARKLKWDLARTMPCAAVDWVRRQHEMVGLTSSSNAWKEQYEIVEFFATYDYYDDGEDLDLHVFYDRSSQRILDIALNEYDEIPIVPMRYQIRPHLAYGLGVLAMLRPFQIEATDVHNHRLLNMLIANVRHWVAVEGQVPDNLEVWGNKVTYVRQEGALKELRMGDIYPSSAQAEEIVMGLGERRVGSEGGIGVGAAPPGRIGTRTPGITAMSTIQSQNARFTPAFDQMRLGTCEALRQCLLRQRERMLMGGTAEADVMAHMRDVLGPESAERVAELLKAENYDRYVQVDFTAVSPQANAAADQQAMVMLWNTAEAQYYKPMMEMVAAVAQANNPALVSIAKQIAEKSTELFDRFLRTFDQTRDPERFLLDFSESLDQMGQEQQAAAAQPMDPTQLLAGLLSPQPGAAGG